MPLRDFYKFLTVEIFVVNALLIRPVCKEFRGFLLRRQKRVF